MWDSLISSVASVFQAILNWILSVISLLVPTWFGTGLSTLFQLINTPILEYMAYILGIDIIIPTLIGAYIVRYLLRRVP
jgi:hypothetical protein